MWVPPCVPEPLIGIGGASLGGCRLAVRYVKKYAACPDRAGACRHVDPGCNSPLPSIVIMLWQWAEPGITRGLARWSARLATEGDTVVLGVGLGQPLPMPWTHPLLNLALSSAECSLDALIDCLVEMLVGPNLVNLRARELHAVLGARSVCRFASGWARGAGAVHSALESALRDRALGLGNLQFRGLWLHVYAPWAQGLLSALVEAQEFAARCVGPDAVIWSGATPTARGHSGVRINCLAACAESATDP